ncbi:unnamed protein product [Lactuca virosa]|uniref:Uncharacterized protein n=1 Tax=Lactuca virosa TaxID=75947 RepID=A0AAU9MBM2_9ASTR|nr:unnamed protein product [Lactuca virosa]
MQLNHDLLVPQLPIDDHIQNVFQSRRFCDSYPLGDCVVVACDLDLPVGDSSAPPSIGRKSLHLTSPRFILSNYVVVFRALLPYEQVIHQKPKKTQDAISHDLCPITLISNFITSNQNMDQKTLLHRKRLVAVNSEAKIFVKGNEEENLLYDKKAALEETVKNLHEEVACLVCECNTKDELMAEHLKTTQEAIAGREKAEAEVAKWKQELEDTLQHNVAAYERLVHLCDNPKLFPLSLLNFR